jgi:hypothetical protein
LQGIRSVAWARLKVIATIVGDVNARVIVILFYFTILVPFGMLSRLFGDPLHLKPQQDSPTYWLNREPVQNELETAKRQG